MVQLLDLADEILLEIAAWVPYNAKRVHHKALRLVNRRLYRIVHDKNLPTKICQKQMPEVRALQTQEYPNPRMRVDPEEWREDWCDVEFLWEEEQYIVSWIKTLHANRPSGSACHVGLAMASFIEGVRTRTLVIGYKADFEALVDLVLIRTLPVPALLLWHYIITRTSRVLRMHYPGNLTHTCTWLMDPPLSLRSKEYLMTRVFNVTVARSALRSACFLVDESNSSGKHGKFMRSASRFMVTAAIGYCRMDTLNLIGSLPKRSSDIRPQDASRARLSVGLAFQARLARLTEAESGLKPYEFKGQKPLIAFDQAVAMQDRMMQHIDKQVKTLLVDQTRAGKVVQQINLSNIGDRVRSAVAAVQDLGSYKTEEALIEEWKLHDLGRWPWI